MKQLIYRSQPFGFDRAMLLGILASARRNNRRDAITGALFCRHDLYLQLIEGPDGAIDILYAKIAADDRHNDVRLLPTATVGSRTFPHWDMLHDESPLAIWSPDEVADGAIEAAGPSGLLKVFASLRRVPGISPPPEPRPISRRRVLVLGATGTIGRTTVGALIERGHSVVCLVRARAGPRGDLTPPDIARILAGAELRLGDATDPASLARDGVQGETFDAVVSCLASRTGSPRDAWAIDYRAHVAALAAAKAAGIPHMVLLSALCVQKPHLAFQQAKLAFEQALVASGLSYAIVRPTAFFKSLSGQVERVRRGKPYLLFGDGRLTACKPISDADLGRYLARCVDDTSLWNRILPIGGPGPAITPREQGAHLFALLGRPERFRHVPVAFLDAVIAGLALGGRVSPALAAKAELARIGRYYATESMLVWDAVAGRYDADATPSTGSETLFDFYARLVSGSATVDRGDHAVF